jgi:hypothetical protein
MTLRGWVIAGLLDAGLGTLMERRLLEEPEAQTSSL